MKAAVTCGTSDSSNKTRKAYCNSNNLSCKTDQHMRISIAEVYKGYEYGMGWDSVVV